MGEPTRAAKLIAESVSALLDAFQHIARCGGFDHADGDYILDCARRVDVAIQEVDTLSAVDQLGDIADVDDG